MRWIERFDLFLLDMDGLLVDTEKLHYQAYRTLCERHGFDLSWDMDQYLHVAHTSSDGLKNALLPKLGGSWESLYAEKKKILMELFHGKKLELMPGVENFLKEVSEARAKRCVVTNSCKEQVEAIKHVLPILKTIPVWVTREDYEAPKPAPDAYLKAIELLFDPGDRVIGFEDSLRGIEALKSAGIDPVLVCDQTHPQMRDVSLDGIEHYHSFCAIPKSFKG